MTHRGGAGPAPAVRVHPARLPRFWDRSAVFVANLRSLFYGNRRQTEILAEQIKGVDSYGGRLLPLIDLLFTGSPNLLLLENGDILATIRSDGSTPIIHTSVSEDQGRTWTEPQPAFKGSGTPSVARLHSGGIVMIYRAKIGRNLGLPALRVSGDGGATWTADLGETVIDRGDGDMMYASALQMPDGSIAVVYGMEDGPRRSEIRFRYLRDLRE